MAAMLLSPGVASAESTQTCKGTVESPGVLAGTYSGDVRIKGACVVNAGPAHVHGTLTLTEGSVLAAAFALNVTNGKANSHLEVRGGIRVERGATLLLGCDPRGFPCLDDPNSNAPTLSSADRVGGSITSQQPLGVVIHNITVGGNVVQVGGGGGVTCTPSGVFATKFMQPVYSAYEDSTFDGSISISDVHSCWLGIASSSVKDSVRLNDNHLADPDAIEILSNHIGDDLACFDNTQHLWDSAEASFGQTTLFPRASQPNSVEGKRLGQCVLASPATDGSPPGPGPF